MAIPELEKERASRALRRYCEKVPLEIRDKLTKDFRFVRSDIELFERRPDHLKPDRYVELVVAKFRYNAKRGSWTLFWSDRNLRWHIYEGLEERREFLELLREVETIPPASSGGRQRGWRLTRRCGRTDASVAALPRVRR